ncbi:uncharacterized protein LOC119594848 [Penaeus monodon]|uniref:uncharacterized protein LOC119594848 n=1 Tax=Penaeus monodon TaxID=6687 RepID=UPI0018A7345F|nr:uncharacterized protein LOC119594848 [Penaeus monodon]
MIKQEQGNSWHVYDKEGSHPDPDKVSAIKALPSLEMSQSCNNFWDDATLAHFNPNKPTVIQVDASQKGIGAAIVQDKPIAYASKSLSETEQRYANIERELLAVSGKDLLLADGLSRLPSTDNQHIGLDLQINFVTFSNETLDQLRQETSRDGTLHGLKEVIIQGWPETMKDLPRMLQQYWSFRDELSVEDGLVIKGSRVIIPASMQKLVLDRIHKGHQGITKCQLRAKESVYWTSINKDIEEIVQQCPTCQEMSRSQTKEILIPHELPTQPWQYVGTDLFHYGENDYLIVADYYSNSEEFVKFASNWEFEHITSSPTILSPMDSSRGLFKTVKNTIDKAKRSNQDPEYGIVNHTYHTTG